MQKLINNDGSIKPHCVFTFLDGKNKNKELRVIATELGGEGVFNAIDTIKNIETNKINKVKRGELLLLTPYKLK